MTANDFTQFINQIAVKEGINDCSIDYKNSSNKGDGYVASIRSISLVGSNKRLDLVLKYATENSKAHNCVPIHEAFVKEIKFYKDIIPAFNDLQKEYKVKSAFDHVPRYYGSIDTYLKEIFALDDLRPLNYVMWDRTQMMNQAHLECSINCFAKMHGCSMALKQLRPNIFEQLKQDMEIDLFDLFVATCGFYKTLPVTIRDIKKLFDPVKEKKYYDKLEQFAQVCKDEMWKSSNNHEFDVILQRDCWCNNVLYQYDDLNKRDAPENIKLLDFQMIKIGSPMLDLTHFFYSIAPEDCLNNLDYYLKLYHSELRKFLAQFNINVDEIFSFEMLMKHWKIVAAHGFGVNFLLKKVMSMDAENVPDIIDDGDKFFDKLILNPQMQKNYEKEMMLLTRHFVDKEFI